MVALLMTLTLFLLMFFDFALLPLFFLERSISLPLFCYKHMMALTRGVLGAFVCRMSSKTRLTIGCQYVIKCYRSFGDETPSMQNMEKDEEASFVITTQGDDNGRRYYPEC
jgi:hypothetical protein